MENKHKKNAGRLEAKTDDFFPIVEEIIQSGGQVRMTVTGNSMYPMLRDRADSVLLVPPKRLKRFDLPLYRRENGSYVLHRILKIKNEGYVMCGDNQTALEPGIRREQIVAVAKEFCRKGKTVSCSNPWYRTVAALWGVLRPFRPQLLRFCLKLRKITLRGGKKNEAKKQ